MRLDVCNQRLAGGSLITSSNAPPANHLLVARTHSYMHNHETLMNIEGTIMKKAIMLFVRWGVSIPLLALSMAEAQWEKQSPIPTNLDVRGLGAPTIGRLFVATDDNSFDGGGALFESSDGGTSWVQRDIPASLGFPLNGLYFYDSLQGWAYGNDNYRTTDGGTTWTQLPSLGSTYFMKFYTATFGFASGNFDRFVSNDAGTSWDASPHNMFTFDFADNQIGFGASDSGIFMTTDGGSTFTHMLSGIATAVIALSRTVAVGIVDDQLVRSIDGGNSWLVVAPASGRNRLLLVSADAILAWGRSGSHPDFDDRILRSNDGGQSWNDLGEVMPAGVFAFAVPEPQTIIASDLNGDMFRSADMGLNWNRTFVSPGPRPGYLSSASPVFPNQLTGYFGYGAGFLIKTTDAGTSWFQLSSGIGSSLNDIDRFPNGNLIAVGDNGAILTSDGVSPWILQDGVTQYGIKAVDVIDSGEVVIVDETGQVYGSTDAGSSWFATTGKPSTLSLVRDISFRTLLDGWVTSMEYGLGALFHTTDGGVSWTPVPDILGVYSSIDAEGMSIWASNVGGSYFRSTDRGTTWIQGTLPGSPWEIMDMDFVDESTGYAVGRGGYAARTDNGGITWEILPTPTDQVDYTDIHVVGPNKVWFSTNNNVVYYSETGGQNWSVMEIGSRGFGFFSGIVADLAGSAWVVGNSGSIEYFAGPPPSALNRPPDPAFTFITSGLTVQFTDMSVDHDGIIVRQSWDFGDGSRSGEKHPIHTFAEANTYVVRLTVTDNDSDSISTGRVVVVEPNPGGTFGNFTEVTPWDSLFVTSQDEDFWVITTAPADYDGDGDLDIAVLGYYVVYNQSVAPRLVLLRNEGPASADRWQFAHTNVPLGTLTVGSSDLAWGDVDGDGDKDLAVGTGGATIIFRNDAGALVRTETDLPGYLEDNWQAYFDLRSITWADYDNDGDMDLLLPSVVDESTFSLRTALMRNDGPDGNGGWIFTETSPMFAPTSHAQSAWLDDDHDGDLDLLLVNVDPSSDGGFFRRYRNDGDGVFVGEDILGSLTVQHGEAQWIDFDADGDLDILVAGNLKEFDEIYTTALRIYRNDSGVFNPLEVIPCISCEGWLDFTAATWADYDNDGDIDILAAGTHDSNSQIEGLAKIYVNTAGVFVDSGNILPAPLASGDRGGTFSWLDLDNDGDLDYLIAGQYFVPGGNGLVSAQMHLYRNDAPGQNIGPSVPTNLGSAREDSTSVVLSWSAGSDDHTPTAALTYSLELFRDHVPSTNPSRLPEPGNVGAVTRWRLTGLEEGGYRWKLSSVDAAYVGSPSAVGEFHIGAQRSVDFNFALGWNLVSVPVITPTRRRSELFPDGASDAYGYAGLYSVVDSMTLEQGYWMKFNAACSVSFYGYPLATGTFKVVEGWNLIGSVSTPIPTSMIQSYSPGMTTSPFYGYEGRYILTDTIEPGKGYWVKVNESGTLILSPSATKGEPSASTIRIISGDGIPPPAPDYELQDPQREIPDRYALGQNCPNPFNPVTVIRYQVPVTGMVRLTICNTLGQEIATLVDGVQEAGYKSVAWRASGFPSGVYFYRLCSGSFTSVKKMVLLE